MTLLSALLSACGVTLLAEAGDKTFFVCALLAAKGNKGRVILGSYSALVLQTIFCIAVGMLFASRAQALESQRVRWDLIIGGLCLLLFGGLAVREAATIETLQDEQDMQCLDEMINQLPNDDPLLLESTPNTSDVFDQIVQEQNAARKQEYVNKDVYIDLDAELSSTADTPRKQLSPWARRRISLELNHSMALKPLSEAATLIQEREAKHVTLQAFGAVFAAELGDRSMFSTIALAATINPVGVAVGVLLGHLIVTLLAVTCASLMCAYLSQKTTTFGAGLLFLVFGFSSLWQAFSIFSTSSV